jgi:hypothetical protein
MVINVDVVNIIDLVVIGLFIAFDHIIFHDGVVIRQV